MIDVSIKFKGGAELGHIRIENMETGTAELGDYSVEFGVDIAEGFAVYQRAIYSFPRKDYNVLGLLRLALSTLEEKELTLDGDPDRPNPSGNARLSRHLARGFD